LPPGEVGFIDLPLAEGPAVEGAATRMNDGAGQGSDASWRAEVDRAISKFSPRIAADRQANALLATELAIRHFASGALDSAGFDEDADEDWQDWLDVIAADLLASVESQ
jgi:hypothetical protein